MLSLLLAIAVLGTGGSCLDNGMALLPAMGFNTWTAFALNGAPGADRLVFRK